MTETLDFVGAVRRFNRFYTRRIGLLDEGHLGSPYSLTEVRVLYELNAGGAETATEVIARLGLDAGYLSRILRRLEAAGLIGREAAGDDARRAIIRVHEAGRRTFEAMQARAEADLEARLAGLGEDERRRMAELLAEVERLLDRPAPAAWRLRPHGPGDLGWVVGRHGALYAEEYGFDARFEALVARIVADFAGGFDPAREACWIAERGGERLGSVFIVGGEPGQAKLRLLLVEPSARGLGVGRALVETAVAFAREAGYREITLWTQSILAAARKIYEAAGFRLAESAPHAQFGPPLIGETWVLPLR